MSTDNHSLPRRVAPAVVLTGASVLGIYLLDHASSRSGRFASTTGATLPTGATTAPTPTSATLPRPSPAGGDMGDVNPAGDPATSGSTVPTNPNCKGTTTTGQPAEITDFRRTYGTVTVSIVTDKAGKVCDVTAMYDVNDRRSLMIEQYSIPRLNASAVASGATTLQAISGATAICEAYAQSLQSALDAAP